MMCLLWGNCGRQRRSGKSRVEPSAGRTSSLSVLLFQSWCKQPCWCELVPVSGQDRAHRLHSDAAPSLSGQVLLWQAAPNWKKAPRLSIMDFTTWWWSRLQTAGNGEENTTVGVPTGRTGILPHCSAAVVNDLIPITQQKEERRRFPWIFFFWVFWLALAVAAAAAAGGSAN